MSPPTTTFGTSISMLNVRPTPGREAGGHLNTWPGTLARIKRELSRNDYLASQLRDWLNEQKEAQKTKS